MTPKQARLEHIEDYRRRIKEYTEEIIPSLEANIANPKYSDDVRGGFEGLLKVAKRELQDNRKHLLELMEFE